MFALRRVLRVCVFVCTAALATAIAMAQSYAQPYAQPQKVYLPLGKVQVARVASVTSIFQHFTAADLEMKPGDLVFALDGVTIDSAERFDEVFGKKTADAYVSIDFVRDGVVHQSVGPVFRFTRGVFASAKPRWGGDVETATADFAASLLEKPVLRRVMVVQIGYVKDNSAAGVAGLQKGDLLISINDSPIARVNRSDIIVPLFPAGTPLHFRYLRDGQLREGDAPLTIVKTGLAKTLSFGFGGDSRMTELKSDDVPEQVPTGATMEIPAT